MNHFEIPQLPRHHLPKEWMPIRLAQKGLPSRFNRTLKFKITQQLLQQLKNMLTFSSCSYFYYCSTLFSFLLWLACFILLYDLLLIESSMSYRATVNLRVYASVAKPNPKMGQSLGPLGINMMKFCEEFNKITTHIRADVPLKVKLTAYTDRTFKFIIKPPETSWFLKKAAGKQKFSPIPGHVMTTPIPIQYVYEIAKIKKELDPDLQKLDVAIIMTMILGQMHTLGGDIVDEPVVPKPISVKLKI